MTSLLRSPFSLRSSSRYSAKDANSSSSISSVKYACMDFFCFRISINSSVVFFIIFSLFWQKSPNALAFMI